MFFQNAIFSIDYYKNKTVYDLNVICGHDYALTMKTYYILKKNGIMLDEWENKYLFEVLPKQKSDSIWKKYNITTMSQFTDYNEAQLEEITSEFPELSIIIKTPLQEH